MKDLHLALEEHQLTYQNIDEAAPGISEKICLIDISYPVEWYVTTNKHGLTLQIGSTDLDLSGTECEQLQEYLVQEHTPTPQKHTSFYSEEELNVFLTKYAQCHTLEELI